MGKRAYSTIVVVLIVLIAIIGGYFLGRKTHDFKFFSRHKEPTQVTMPTLPPATTPNLTVPAGLTDFEKRVMLAANKAMPAVVSIYVEQKVEIQSNPYTPFFNDPFFRHFFGGQPFMNQPREEVQKALGSGVIVSSDGYILTNNHVVANADLIKISMQDKRTFNAKVIGKDSKTDLALIKINAIGLPALPMADSNKISVGQFVLAIGNPFGLSSSVTMGIVSAKGRANLRVAEYEDFIQTDAPINPGNSGGALVDLNGELVGINTAIFSPSGGSLGIGFAIPADMAKGVMESLLKFGKVVRGYLGVTVQELTPELRKSFGYQGDGALVAEVMQDSPADKTGLQAGDIIYQYRGQKVASSADLKNMVGETAPGEKAEIDFVRDGKNLKVTAEVIELKVEQPAPAKPGKEKPARLGLTVQDLTPEIRSQLSAPRNLDGVVIAGIEPGSRTDAAGLKAGDVVMRVNQTAVKNTRDFTKALEGVTNDQVLLWIWRDSRTLFVVVPPIGGESESPENPQP